MDLETLVLPKIASVKEIQREYRRLFDWVKTERKPLYIFKNNQPEVVVVDVEDFETMTKKIRKFEEKRAFEAIAVGERELKEGKTKVLKSLTDLWNKK